MLQLVHKSPVLDEEHISDLTVSFSEFLVQTVTTDVYRLAVWLLGIEFVHNRVAIYLGILRSSARTQMANERRATEPDWCVAASGVGTYSNRVLIPRATCP